MNQKLWSRRARSITPYVAGEQPRMKNLIKLNTNENPYPPSPKAIAALESYNADALRLYPNADAEPLMQAAADRHGLTPSHIFCGNGSDEVLAIAFQAFFDDTLTLPDITYSFYPVWASLYGVPLRVVPLKEDFTIPVDAFLHQKNVIFPNPNAPTGIALSRAEIESIVKTASGVVVIDEAYVEFGAESVMPLVREYDNLVVVRTLSKSHSLAGLRVGYAAAHPDLICAMRCIKDSFNSYPLDSLAQTAAAAALADSQYTDRILESIIGVREFTAGELCALGYEVLPSQSNFLFCRPPQDAAWVMGKLREQGIIVRRFGGARIENYLRITIGTRQQMETLIEVLRSLGSVSEKEDA